MRRGIERGCEEKREGSPILIFQPLRFKIVRKFPDSVGFFALKFQFYGENVVDSF